MGGEGKVSRTKLGEPKRHNQEPDSSRGEKSRLVPRVGMDKPGGEAKGKPCGKGEDSGKVEV